MRFTQVQGQTEFYYDQFIDKIHLASMKFVSILIATHSKIIVKNAW